MNKGSYKTLPTAKELNLSPKAYTLLITLCILADKNFVYDGDKKTLMEECTLTNKDTFATYYNELIALSYVARQNQFGSGYCGVSQTFRAVLLQPAYSLFFWVNRGKPEDPYEEMGGEIEDGVIDELEREEPNPTYGKQAANQAAPQDGGESLQPDEEFDLDL